MCDIPDQPVERDDDQHRAAATGSTQYEGGTSPCRPAIEKPLATGRHSLSPRRPLPTVVLLNAASLKTGSNEAFTEAPGID
jgi:hypothetical protein